MRTIRALLAQQNNAAANQAAVQLAQMGVQASTGTGTQAQHYSLPTLLIRRFSGDREQWVEFWESFKSAVDCRLIADSEELNYLRNFLDGEARKVIEGLPLIDANYAIAKKILLDHYSDEEAYIRALYGRLDELHPCKKFEVVKALAIELERIARQLENRGERIDSPSVFMMLERKLTPKILREILKKKAADTTTWTTTKFRTALATIIQEEEAIQTVIREATCLQENPFVYFSSISRSVSLPLCCLPARS